MPDADPPVSTDADVLRLARDVLAVDAADRGSEPRTRTLWILFLDDEDRPLDVQLPIADLPADPDPEHVERLATVLHGVVRAGPAERVVVVWDRPGDGAARMQEADWMAALARTDLPIRAQLLATDDGVRIADPEFEAIVAV